MRILRHHRNVPKEAQGAVVALGNFDGVHRGHQALIREAKKLARAGGKPLAILVFEPYPQEYFRPGAEPFRLTSFRAKARLLGELEADFLIVLHFDAALANMHAQDFVMEVLIAELAVAHVVVGEDFRFGKARGGDITVLAYMGEMEGFAVTVVPPLADGPEAKISSSRIRAALKEGRPEEAARLLGHFWSVESHVRAGDRRGKSLGFPTANLVLEGVLVPKFGVYAVRAHVGDTAYDGVANFGRRPMFEVREPLLEVHIFDFAKDLYGQLLRVEFIAYLRPELKFESLDALKAQIASDGVAAKMILARRPAPREDAGK
jgi:riboflavin kinase/FMN adenylyltransferase